MKSLTLLRIVGITTLVAAGCDSPPDTPDPAAPQTATSSSSEALRILRPERAVAEVVTQTNLVSDVPGQAAVTDPNLVNAWGLAFNPKGIAWVSAAEEGLSAVYDATGATLLDVTVPPPAGGTPPSAPTGQVFNGDAAAFGGDAFIFATEDGTISGWQLPDGTAAVLRVDRSADGAIYKGITIGKSLRGPRLYAADFHNARVDVYDGGYAPVATTGHFEDHALPRGYAPFNVLAQGGFVLVTYALQDADGEDDVKGPGNGFVDLYDTEGHLLRRLISRGALNSPWGMAIQTFGVDADGLVRLLVGNFGDGRINVYEVTARGGLRVELEGAVGDASGAPLVIDGLWALAFGPGAGGFGANELYFTAGPGDESHGLFGKLSFQ